MIGRPQAACGGPAHPSGQEEGALAFPWCTWPRGSHGEELRVWALCCCGDKFCQSSSAQPRGHGNMVFCLLVRVAPGHYYCDKAQAESCFTLRDPLSTPSPHNLPACLLQSLLPKGPRQTGQELSSPGGRDPGAN